jgi:putative acetyltransferase
LSAKLLITLRTATFEDIPAIKELYSSTVRTVNAPDYTPEQIDVWARGSEGSDRLKDAVAAQYFVLAEIEGELAGFCTICKDGYLDFLYVSKDHQRFGVAQTMLEEIEKKARQQANWKIYSHVSKTAKGFFIKNGYKHEKDLQDIYKGVEFINALMVKYLNLD